MQWWRWAAAAMEAVLLIILLLLWLDAIRERRGVQRQQVRRLTVLGAVVIPVAFFLVLLLPLWMGLILIAIPAIAVIVMALAS